MWAKTLQAAVVSIAVSIAIAGCNLTHLGTNSGGDDPLALPGSDSVSHVELHGLSTAHELPPIVPATRGHISDKEIAGPRHPAVTLNLPLPFSSPPSIIQGIDVDGTVFVAGYDGVGAARDGKMQWAYRVNAATEFGLANDGDLWFTKSGTGQSFVLNRDGQGGLLPASFRRPPEAGSLPMVGCSGNLRWLRGFGKDIPLDYECTRPQAILGPDNIGYAGTDAPDLRAVTRDGTMLWKIKTPCAAETLLSGPGGREFFSCQDNSIHYVENGVIKWSQPGDGEMSGGNNNMPHSSFLGLMDRDGTVYFVDSPKSSVATHIHAVTSTGKMLWTIETPGFMVSSMQFDARGRIYLSGQRGMSQRLVCIAD